MEDVQRRALRKGRLSRLLRPFAGEQVGEIGLGIPEKADAEGPARDLQQVLLGSSPLFCALHVRGHGREGLDSRGFYMRNSRLMK